MYISPAQIAWEKSGQPKISDETYRNEIQPRLKTISLRSLMLALNVCESYAANIRTGQRRPHIRHWEKLAELSGGSVDIISGSGPSA